MHVIHSINWCSIASRKNVPFHHSDFLVRKTFFQQALINMLFSKRVDCDLLPTHPLEDRGTAITRTPESRTAQSTKDKFSVLRNGGTSDMMPRPSTVLAALRTSGGVDPDLKISPCRSRKYSWTERATKKDALTSLQKSRTSLNISNQGIGVSLGSL